MEILTGVLIAVTVIVFSLLIWDKLSSRKLYRFPPGPKGLPLLGCPWYIFHELHPLLTDFAEKWGDYVYLNILGQNIVALNTPEAVRDAFCSGEVLQGRPKFASRYMESSTAFMGPTKQWSTQRKLIHKILNMYGEGVEATENVIREELDHVIQWLETKQSNGEPINLDDAIYPSVTNIILVLLQGKRYDYDSKVLKNVQLLDESATKTFETVNRLLLTLFPSLQDINIGPGKDAIVHHRASEQLIRDVYETTKATYKPGVTRGMIDYLIRYQKETLQEDGVTSLEEKSIIGIILEMVIAGSFTTRSGLYSFFRLLVHKPEVGRRIRSEIKSVTGHQRPVKIQDKSDMPYTMATILEVLRYTSHLPLGVPHLTTEDAQLGDYFLPKGTTLLANTWRFHHDSNLWPEPWEFKPERYLDENQKLLPPEHPNRKASQPFGIGRRSCAGEVFAKSRMFVFITTLLQRFDFELDAARPQPSHDPRTYNTGMSLCPQKYYVHIKLRD